MGGMTSDTSPTSETESNDNARSTSPSPSPSPRCSPDPETVAQYDSLMRALLGDTAIQRPLVNHGDSDESDGESRPMTKAEKQNAKKKRRKERERMAKLDAEQHERKVTEQQSLETPVDFRLFSSCPVQGVVIAPPMEDYPLPTNPRLRPRSEASSSRIHSIASEAAVDAGQIGVSATSNDTGPIRSLAVASHTIQQAPPLCVLSIPLPRSHDHLAPAKSDSRRKKRAIEVVEVMPTMGQSPVKRSRRKRRRYERPLPAYWHDQGLGGRAAGYAMGHGL